jgi:hypothetical protein
MGHHVVAHYGGAAARPWRLGFPLGPVAAKERWWHPRVSPRGRRPPTPSAYKYPQAPLAHSSNSLIHSSLA